MTEWAFISGDPWARCDRCSAKVRMSQTRKQWDGLRACERCYDRKHPGLSSRSVYDHVPVRDARPDNAPATSVGYHLPQPGFGWTVGYRLQARGGFRKLTARPDD